MYIYFAITGLVNALTSTFLGIVVYLRDRENSINKMFAFLCFGFAAWSYPYIMWPLVLTKEETLFWFRILHFGAIFIPIFYFHFVLVWIKEQRKKKWQLILGYCLAVFFCFFVFSPLFISDMVPKFAMNWWAVPGAVYHIYLIYFFGFYIYASILLFLRYKKSVGIEQKQLKFILIGIVFSIISGSTNYLLFYNINFPPYLNIFASLYVILISYAILKHHLFEIKVIATELFTVFVSIILLINALYSQTLVEGILKFSLFAATAFFGYLLIKSVIKEVEQKEKLAQLTITLQKANSELRQLDDAKTEFISIASHQLRTPLTAIKGYISMMTEGDYGKFTGEQMDVLRKLYASNQRLICLVENLLDISRMEQGRMNYLFENINIEDLARDVVDELVETAKIKNLDLRFIKTKSAVSKIVADEQKIRQVFMNLVDNAIKYTEKGSIEVKLEKKKDSVLFSVKDTGLGVKPEDKGKLFKRFSRGSSMPKLHVNGSGLGLYVVLKVTEAHHGKVWVESAGEGKGSTFFVSLPVG